MGFSRVLHSMNSGPWEVERERERLWALRPGPAMDPRCTTSFEELNLCATMSSRTCLKSSKKIVSDAHLKTSANRQYGLIPLLAVTLAALTAMSVTRKTMDNSIQSNMTPNLLLIRTKDHTLKLYVFPIASISFQVVKIHQGSRTRASHGRMRTLTSDPSELK